MVKTEGREGRGSFYNALAIIFLYDIVIGETIVGLLLYHNLWVLLLPTFVGSTVF